MTSTRYPDSGAKMGAWRQPGSRYLAAFTLGGLLTWALGCTGAADLPNVPDLSELEESYAAPSAELMQAPAVQAVLQSMPDLQQVGAAFRSAGDLLQPIDEASATAGNTGGAGVSIRGTVHLELRCPGVADTPVYDAATNGTFALDLAVQRNSIRRAFSGEANHCLARSRVGNTSVPFELDGGVEIDIGSDIRLGRPWTRTSVLMSLEGTMTVAGVALQNVSARFESDLFEILVQTPRGTVVLFATDAGVGLRDQEATWYCGLDTTTCAVR